MPELAAILGDVVTWADVLKAVHHRISKPRAPTEDSSGTPIGPISRSIHL